MSFSMYLRYVRYIAILHEGILTRLKLHVFGLFFVQIFDRLASSIGQDVLDSFYYVLSLKEYRKKDILPLVFYSAVAAVYIRIQELISAYCKHT